MSKIFILFIFSILLFACTQKDSVSHVCGLQADEVYLDYPVDDETVIPLFNLYTFKEKKTMRSIKPGSGPSMMYGVSSIFAALLGKIGCAKKIIGGT